jgi:hypothetical protein
MPVSVVLLPMVLYFGELLELTEEHMLNKLVLSLKMMESFGLLLMNS